jgi:membrane-associated protease RseP (regulator of RpoE activity)
MLTLPATLGDILVSVLLITFIIIWAIILLIPEEKFRALGIERSPISLIVRSKKGLEIIDRQAKKRAGFFKRLGNFAIYISLPLMALVVFLLFLSAFNIVTTPDAPAGISPILPEGVADIKGAPSVPWEYWLLSIIVILVAHELMHGLVARAEDIPVKSLGIFFVTLVPLGAFVEPDDEALEKKSSRSKLRVYAAGSMGNFLVAVTGALILLFLLVIIAPLSFHAGGLEIFNVTTGSPAESVGIQKGMLLLGIGDVKIEDLQGFSEAVPTLTPGVTTTVETDQGIFTVVPEKREGFKSGFIGIAVIPQVEAKPLLANTIGGERALTIYRNFTEAFYWIFFLNLAVGLTNLLPIVPLDGGRMFSLLSEKWPFKWAREITTFINVGLIILVIINIGPHFGLF